MAQYSSNLIGIPMGGYGMQATRMSALGQMAGAPRMMYPGGNPDFDRRSGRIRSKPIGVGGSAQQPVDRGPLFADTPENRDFYLGGNPDFDEGFGRIRSRGPIGGSMQQPRIFESGAQPIGGNPVAPRFPRAGAGTPVPKANTPEVLLQQHINRLREIEAAQQRKYGANPRQTVVTPEDVERDRLSEILRRQGYTRDNQNNWAKTGPRINLTGRTVNGSLVFDERPMTPAEEAAEAAKAARRGQSMGYRGF